MKHILLLCLCLAGCGGGSLGDLTGPITVTVQPGAITCNSCSVTITVPGGAASAPSSPASAPPASQPPQPTASVPLCVMSDRVPLNVPAGCLSWTSGGMTYAMFVRGTSDFGLVLLASSPAVPATTWVAEANFGDADLSIPVAADDAAIKAWISTTILPNAQAWFQANKARFAAGAAVAPVSSQTPPATWTDRQRASARLAQFVAFDPAAGFSLRP